MGLGNLFLVVHWGPQALRKCILGCLTLSVRGLSEAQILRFSTLFRASQYLIFSLSESTIKAHRMILNVHFRHKKFVDEVKFAKVHKTRPKLKMTQISTCIQQFEVLCPWEGKLLQITCYLFVNFLFFPFMISCYSE